MRCNTYACQAQHLFIFAPSFAIQISLAAFRGDVHTHCLFSTFIMFPVACSHKSWHHVHIWVSILMSFHICPLFRCLFKCENSQFLKCTVLYRFLSLR